MVPLPRGRRMSRPRPKYPPLRLTRAAPEPMSMRVRPAISKPLDGISNSSSPPPSATRRSPETVTSTGSVPPFTWLPTRGAIRTTRSSIVGRTLTPSGPSVPVIRTAPFASVATVTSPACASAVNASANPMASPRDAALRLPMAASRRGGCRSPRGNPLRPRHPRASGTRFLPARSRGEVPAPSRFVSRPQFARNRGVQPSPATPQGTAGVASTGIVRRLPSSRLRSVSVARSDP